MLRLISMRDYTEHGMSAKLLAAGFQPDDVERCVKLAVESRLIDDMRYAELYIVAKKESGWGCGKIIAGLHEKGIDCSAIEGFPDDLFPFEEEVERASRCLLRHKTSSKNPREAHFRFLMSKGYSNAVCARALELNAR